MKRFPLLLFIASFAILSCKSAKVSNDDPDWIRNKPDGPDLGVAVRILDSKTEHWVEITPPAENINFRFGKVFVEKVSRVFYNQRLGFLVSGNLPNACSTLHSVKTQVFDNEIIFDIESRQDPGILCADVLQPFDLFYDQVDEETFAKLRVWRSNDVSATFNE